MSLTAAPRTKAVVAARPEEMKSRDTLAHRQVQRSAVHPHHQRGTAQQRGQLTDTLAPHHHQRGGVQQASNVLYQSFFPLPPP